MNKIYTVSNISEFVLPRKLTKAEMQEKGFNLAALPCNLRQGLAHDFLAKAFEVAKKGLKAPKADLQGLLGQNGVGGLQRLEREFPAIPQGGKDMLRATKAALEALKAAVKDGDQEKAIGSALAVLNASLIIHAGLEGQTQGPKALEAAKAKEKALKAPKTAKAQRLANA